VCPLRGCSNRARLGSGRGPRVCFGVGLTEATMPWTRQGGRTEASEGGQVRTHGAGAFANFRKAKTPFIRQGFA